VREFGWGREGKFLLSGDVGKDFSESWVKSVGTALVDSFLGSGIGGSHSHIGWRHVTEKPGISCFSAEYSKLPNMCHIITSALALPNLIIKRGDKLLFVAVFNHGVGTGVKGKAVRSESNILVVVVDTHNRCVNRGNLK